MRSVVACIVLAGCGRIGFDAFGLDATPACKASDLGPGHDVMVGTAPTSSAAGDLDRDGKLDLVVQHGTSVGVLRGHGDGTFDPIVDFPAADGACSLASEAVAIADLDHDGALDVVTTDCTGVNSATDGGAIVLLGNGDGTLRPWVRYSTGNAVNGIAIADLGNGNADLVATDYYGSTVIGILLGNGDGTFRPHVDYSVDAFPSDVAVADLDGDSKLDLAVANESGVGISVMLGNGDGTFRTTVGYASGTSPESVVAADVDGDGKLDLVVANSAEATNKGIAILRGNGDGTFQTATTLADDYPWSVAVRVDAPLDIVVANNANPGMLEVLHGNGDGTFQPGVAHAVGSFPTSALIADLDGDGVQDVVVANNSGNTVTVLLGTCLAR